jgi:multiple antibiotic resistance protein
MITSLAVTLFLIMDPFGNLPVFLTLLKDYSQKEKIKIIIRELFFSLFVIILFIFFGKSIMNFLGLKEESILIAGGIILFLIALKMIFPSNEPLFSKENDLFLVPIAIPMIAGPSLLATLILFSSQYSPVIVLSAAIIAWTVSFIIILFSILYSKYIPKRVFIAIEKLMGMLLIALSVQMLLDGIGKYLHLVKG